MLDVATHLIKSSMLGMPSARESAPQGEVWTPQELVTASNFGHGYFGGFGEGCEADGVGYELSLEFYSVDEKTPWWDGKQVHQENCTFLKLP